MAISGFVEIDGLRLRATANTDGAGTMRAAQMCALERSGPRLAGDTPALRVAADLASAARAGHIGALEHFESAGRRLIELSDAPGNATRQAQAFIGQLNELRDTAEAVGLPDQVVRRAVGDLVEENLLSFDDLFTRGFYEGVAHRGSSFQGFSDDATQRAEDLLVRHLTPQQSEDYRTNGAFDVFGGRTGHRYRIHKNRTINVADYGRRRRLCLVTPSTPLGDQLLTQKLLLETAEDEFERTAIAWDWHDA